MGLGPKLRNDGLVYTYDAGNHKSHSSGSLYTTNLNNHNQTGSFENGVSGSNGSFIFDGTDDKILLDETTNLGPISTVEILYKRDAPTGNMYPLGNTTTNDYNNGYHILTWTGGVLVWCQPTYFRFDATNTFNNTDWVWLTIVRTSLTTCKCYKDGVQVATEASEPTMTGDKLFDVIGGRADLTSPFGGEIRFIRAYDTTKTDEEVLYNYNELKHRFGLN
jgi:hypothetical protein